MMLRKIAGAALTTRWAPFIRKRLPGVVRQRRPVGPFGQQEQAQRIVPGIALHGPQSLACLSLLHKTALLIV
jgi:hypothetical protein